MHIQDFQFFLSAQFFTKEGKLGVRNLHSIVETSHFCYDKILLVHSLCSQMLFGILVDYLWLIAFTFRSTTSLGTEIMLKLLLCMIVSKVAY